MRGGAPLKGNGVTFSSRTSEALVIRDASLVPEEFRRQTIVIDIPKDPIKKAIKAGHEVPGTDIEYHTNLVRK